MNMVNSVLLRLLLMPSSFYRKMGVNVEHLRLILNAKLIMDDRRPNTFQQMQRKSSDRPVRLATVGTMIWAAVMGVIFLSSFLFGNTYETKFTIYFSFYVTILASILIADFTNVLIDIRDNFIILPKPVSDRTFVLSRLLHIVVHICKLVIPMVLPAVIFLVVHIGIGSLPPFLLVVLMATLFTIFLINACYILILRLTTPSRFQAIISYIQIVLAVLFFAAYQLIPRLIDQVALSQYELSDRPAIMFLPTYWFAGAWQQLFAWNGTFKLWTCLALTMVVPFLSIWVVIKYFAPSFNRKLSMITADGHVPATSKSPIKNPASGYSNLLSKLFTKPGIERTSFLFTWKMMLRSRNFKMKVYPSIGYIVVILFIMLIENKNVSFYDITSQTSKGIMHTLMLIYFSNLLLMAALGQISMYEKYKAAWPFFTTPINTPGYIISGSVKAAIAQFFFPFAVVIFVFLTSLAGPMVIPNVLLGIANELLITAVAAYIGISKLPFSSPQQNASGNTLRLFFLMILSVLVAIAHYFVYQILIVVSIFALLSFTATWLVLDAVRRLPWSKVYQSYSED